MLTSMPAAMRSPEYSGIYYAREGEADQELGIRSKERCTSDNNGFFYSAGMQGMRIILCVWCFYASCDSEDMQTRR